MSEKKLTKCLLLKIRSCDLILERFLDKQEFPVPKKKRAERKPLKKKIAQPFHLLSSKE